MKLPRQSEPILRKRSPGRVAWATGIDGSARKPCSAYPCDTDADCPAGCTCDGFGSCE